MDKRLLSLFLLFALAILATQVFADGVDCPSQGCCNGYFMDNSTVYKSCFLYENYTGDGTCYTSFLCTNDMRGVGNLGSDMGDFLGNLGPGVGTMILLLAIFGGIGALIYAIVFAVKTRISK